MESSHDRTEDEAPETDRSDPHAGPTSLLLAAAMMGLFGGGCDGQKAEPEPDPHACETTGTGGTAGQTGTTTGTGGGGTGGTGGAGTGAGGPTVISEVEGNKTFAEIEAECDDRGGFTQVHAACSGVNGCAGFSYGDWNPGVLTEHTCAGVNGCNGISCVVLPEDSGKTGKEIYEEALPETGPRSCTNCHAVWGDDGPDLTKFKLYLLAGSPRNESNWLDYPAPAQVRTVAFGKQGLLPNGAAYSAMAGYHKLYSRAEIERVVEYIRTSLQVVPATIKVSD